ncbi:MAG: FAD-binding protein [Theionarchaea archaeon]|nr:FAD-binding protein [Theionarchaea archaeon]
MQKMTGEDSPKIHSLIEKKCHILIIGGGGAGIQAALAVASTRDDLRVILVDKGVLGKSGCTILGGFSCNAVLETSPDDSPSHHFEDTVREGRFINDQPLVEIYTQKAPERVKELHRMGGVFEEENGVLKQELVPGHSHPRALFNNLHTGKSMAMALRRGALESDVEICDECIILRILVHDSVLWGAVGFDIVQGKFILFECPAIIITTGGCGQLYRHSTTSLGSTGDGLALAYEAGAELQDMEFIQFFPTTQCYPRLLNLNPTFPSMLRYTAGCRLYNSEGREFLKDMNPDWTYAMTRDEVSQAIYREIQEGRGSPHGGVYMDVLHLSPEEIKKKFSFSQIYSRLLSMGIDLTKDVIETTVSAHFSMGGIRVDSTLQTCVGGLFAAGEAIAGVHGANRLPGNALSEILVTGYEAAIHAIHYVDRMSPTHDHSKVYDGSECEALSALLKRESGISPIALKKSIQEIMWDHVGVIRDKRGLEDGLHKIEALTRDFEAMSLASQTCIWNKELIDAFEVGFMTTVARLIAQGALFREESRGSHFRQDFPESDHKTWLVNIIHKKGNYMTISRPRISRMPLEGLYGHQ